MVCSEGRMRSEVKGERDVKGTEKWCEVKAE